MTGCIELFVVDVDGTLLTPDKELTAAAARAVHELRDAGVRVALTSGRPPRGLRMLVDPLEIDTPMVGFNGGMVVHPDMTVLSEDPLDPDAAHAAADLIRAHGLELWVYRGTQWYVHDGHTPHVAKEQRTVRFPPTYVEDLDFLLEGSVKLVGVTDDPLAMRECEAAAQELERPVSATRSQPYYLDVTNPRANKGSVVARLGRQLGIPKEAVATIGDMPSDVAMFESSGLSIAMGNASADVKEAAERVTTANTEEGFAHAVRSFVLPRAPANHRGSEARAHEPADTARGERPA